MRLHSNPTKSSTEATIRFLGVSNPRVSLRVGPFDRTRFDGQNEDRSRQSRTLPIVATAAISRIVSGQGERVGERAVLTQLIEPRTARTIDPRVVGRQSERDEREGGKGKRARGRMPRA